MTSKRMNDWRKRIEAIATYVLFAEPEQRLTSCKDNFDARNTPGTESVFTYIQVLIKKLNERDNRASARELE